MGQGGRHAFLPRSSQSGEQIFVRHTKVAYIKNEQWSPKQISGYLKREESIKVSHETIYKLIRQDASGEPASNCRHKMKYHCKSTVRHQPKSINIRNRVSIHERPAEGDGKRFGDWEMDLIVDKDSNAILTMIERSTNFLIMEKLKQGKKAMPLAKTVLRLLIHYKGELLRTITTDNGGEFAEYEWIAKHLKLKIYFTDSFSSWQKGLLKTRINLSGNTFLKGLILVLSPTKESNAYKQKETEGQ